MSLIVDKSEHVDSCALCVHMEDCVKSTAWRNFCHLTNPRTKS